MSSYNTQARARASSRTRILAVSVMLAIFVSGCGFRPLFGRHTDENGRVVPDQLALIHIAPIGDRAGVLLRNQLYDRMAPRGPSGSPLYELDITISSGTQSTLIRTDATATRANLLLTASFILKSTDPKHSVVLVNDSVRSMVSYDILDAQFATVSAERNAQERAVHEVTSEIVTRLAVYFSHPAVDRPPTLSDIP